MAKQSPTSPNQVTSLKSSGKGGPTHGLLSSGDRLLVLLCLTGIVIAAPVLVIMRESPELFSFYNVDSFALMTLYALTVALVPPILLYVAGAVAGLWTISLGRYTHYATVAALAGLWLIQWVKWTLDIDQPWLITPVAVAGGLAFLFAYRRWKTVSSLLKFAAFAPLLAIGFFLYSPGITSVTKEHDVEIQTVETDTKRPSVVFILLDEFPTMSLLAEHGTLDTVRFPHLAELMKQAVWYRHFTVLADKTNLSVPTIIAGDLPRPRVPRMANFPNNLFTLLAPTHHLTVFEAVTKLCDFPECSHGAPGAAILRPRADVSGLLRQTVSIWLQRISIRNRGTANRDEFKETLVTQEVKSDKCAKNLQDKTMLANLDPECQVERSQHKLQRMSQFIDTFTDSQKPALYFIHLEMPHIPWRFFGDGQLYRAPFTRDAIAPLNDTGGEWLARVSEYRYLMQAQFTDQLLGGVFERLKKLGIWDDILLIVTADHGRSFELDTNSRAATPQTYDSIVYAPLFIKRPGQERGSIDDSNLMAHDILPTIADILDIDSPWPMAGLPVGAPGIAERADEKIFYPRADKTGFGMGIEKRATFSDSAHFPKHSSRRIGALKQDDNALEQLNQALELDLFWGRSPKDFRTKKGGSALVDELALLRNPKPDEASLGMVVGNIEYQPTGNPKVLISVNDRLVTGSPLVEFRNVPNTFIAMLPEDVLTDRNDIGVYLVDRNELIELEIH